MTAVALDSSVQHTERVTATTSVMLLLAIIGLLVTLSRSPELASLEPQSKVAAIDPALHPRAHATAAREKEIAKRFQEAVMMLHAKQYDYAITALHRVIELSPRMPEAYVNMGFALLGLKKYKAAGDFFNAAINLRPYQANAYWGLAVSLEGRNDLEGALGAMRTYIHLAPSDPKSRDYVRRARSAIWEWDTRLKRGPLPPEHAEFLNKRGKQWAERNSPDHDAPRSPHGEALKMTQVP
ncbi:MAG: tetratricopeptide repeat protein [Gammaproteobacteria bacterium]